MILFERFLFDRRLFRGVMHHSVTWKTPVYKHMLAVSWSLTKRDWWKSREDAEAKFFSVDWNDASDDWIITRIYICRFAAVWVRRPKGIDPTEST